MDENFLKQAKKKILATSGLSIEGLSKKLGVSHSQASRILTGDTAYKVHYTPIIREYIGFDTFDDLKGNKMAVLDMISLKDQDSFNNADDILAQFQILDAVLPDGIERQNIKIVKTPSDEYAPDFKLGDVLFVDIGDILPEPPGIFLIWTGMGYRLQHCQYVIGSNPPYVKMSVTANNAEYESIQIKLDEADIKGRVIGKISMLQS